ncbi:MAG TPA: galactose-1-phosphate uridylyltransferase [Firmicutes bacterium]|nr:galactose-1-phosphate uridylyltransferase [Bacillota bacterium]
MSELRKDPVTNRWVIISTERGKRPSDFAPVQRVDRPKLCPFCPGNEERTPPEVYAVRPSGGAPNSRGWEVRVVPNKYPALRTETEMKREGIGMFDMMSGVGAHEVIIETPHHDERFWDYSESHIETILDTYLQRYRDLRKDFRLRYVLIFKNEGEQAGASLAHSHSQLIATAVIPKRVREELDGAERYFVYKERCVFCDQIREEARFAERMVHENEHFVAYCPFASRFPFEVTVIPKRHAIDPLGINSAERAALAEMLRTITRKLNEALDSPQYNWIFHVAPANRSASRDPYLDECFHWHIEIIPRLTKIAGFEWGTGFYINPTTPEDAAGYLREVLGRGSDKESAK